MRRLSDTYAALCEQQGHKGYTTIEGRCQNCGHRGTVTAQWAPDSDGIPRAIIQQCRPCNPNAARLAINKDSS